MIGGNDITVATHVGPEAMSMALRIAVRTWPDAVLEDAQTGETFSPSPATSWHGHAEVLVYRDAKARERWHEIGADASLNGTLLHIMLAGNAMTVVVDEPPQEAMMSYIATLGHALRQNRFFVSAA